MRHEDTPAITRPVVIEAQLSDLPEEAVEDVRQLWRARELGNDYYYYPFDIVEDAVDWDGNPVYPHLIAYMKEHNLESALIHFWW